MQYLNNSEFAKLAGVSRQAVGKGIIATPPIIHKEKNGINPGHPLNKQYLSTSRTGKKQNHALRKATAGTKQTTKINGIIATIEPPPIEGQNFGELAAQAANESLEKIKLENKKLKEQIKKLEIENAKNEKLYVPREFILTLHEKMNSVIVSTFHTAGKQLIDKMDSIYENSDETKSVEAEHEITKYLHTGLDEYKEASLF